MNLLAQLSDQLAPVMRQLADQFGVRVTVYRATEAVDSEGRTTRTYLADDVLVGIACYPEPAQALQNETRQRPFGLVPSQVGSLGFPRLPDGSYPAIRLHDGLKTTDGPWAGYTWLATADGSPDPGGFLHIVPVVGAPPGLTFQDEPTEPDDEGEDGEPGDDEPGPDPDPEPEPDPDPEPGP